MFEKTRHYILFRNAAIRVMEFGRKDHLSNAVLAYLLSEMKAHFTPLTAR